MDVNHNLAADLQFTRRAYLIDVHCICISTDGAVRMVFSRIFRRKEICRRNSAFVLDLELSTGAAASKGAIDICLGL